MAESSASSTLSDAPRTLDQLEGCCAGKGALDQIEGRRLETYFSTLQEPSEWQEPTDNGERPKPSNSLTPWKEPNSGIIFRCRQPQNAEGQLRCNSKVSSLDFSDHTIDTESGPFTPKGQTQSAVPEIQKQTSFTVPHTWLDRQNENSPEPTLPDAVTQTVLDAVLQRTKPLVQGSKNQQAQPVASGVEDSHHEVDAKATTKGFNLPSRADVPPNNLETKAGDETEVARRIFLPASQQTVLDKLLLHEYRVRGLLVMPVEIPTDDKGPSVETVLRRNGKSPIEGVTRTTYRIDKIIDELDAGLRGTRNERTHNRRHVRFEEAHVGNPGMEGAPGLGRAGRRGRRRKRRLHDSAMEEIADWMQRVMLTKQRLEAEAEASRQFGPGRSGISEYLEDPRYGPVHAEPGGGYVPLTEEEFRERRRNLMLHGTPTPGAAGAANRPPAASASGASREAAAAAAGPVARNMTGLRRVPAVRNMTELRPAVPGQAAHRRQWPAQALHTPEGQRPDPAEESPAATPAPAPARPRNVERPARAAGNQPRNAPPVRRPSRLRRASVDRRPTSTRHTPPSQQTLLEIAAQRRAAAAPAGAISGDSNLSEEWDPGCVPEGAGGAAGAVGG